MKISIPLFTYIFFQFIFYTGNGQKINGDDAQENLLKLGGADAAIGVVRKFDNRYEGVKGSPFYFDYWANGSIVKNDGQQIDNIRLKYNAYEDALIINKKSGQFYLAKNEIKSFVLKEKTHGTNVHFLNHRNPKKGEEHQFYRIIYLGKINLVEHVKVIFEKANFEGGYSNDKRYDEFKKYASLYYFGEQTSILNKLKTTANGISKIFPDHNKELKKQILDKGYDCKNEQDLIAIMNYYDSIK